MELSERALLESHSSVVIYKEQNVLLVQSKDGEWFLPARGIWQQRQNIVIELFNKLIR